MNVKIILISMVKNESKIIERLMRSVVNYIDGYVIADTGSTDNTVELAKSFMKDNNKEGCVVEIPWVNFGISRTYSASEAFKWVNQQGWDNYNTWGLLLDGDMILPDPIDKHSLSMLPWDTIRLNQKNSSIIYENTRLIRMTKEWKCIGPTHEYWETGNSGALPTPVIQDLNDGGSKSDKFERDIRMLKEELKINPTHDRTLFYLGQSYQSIKKYKKSNLILKRRIDAGGWNEEIYMAYIYRGNNYVDMGQPKKAICEWTKAWNTVQKRTEAAMKLVKYYRNKSNMQFIALMYLEKLIHVQFGKNLMGMPVGNPVVNDCVLFLEHDNIKTIWKELAILCYYTGHKKEAYIAIDEQILNTKNNFNERNELLGYQKWYDIILKTTKTKNIKINKDMLPWKNESDWDIWKSYNPSIRVNKSEYDIILRHSNYSTVDAKQFPCRGRHDYIITRNVLCKMDTEFNIKNTKELVVPVKYIENKESHIQGMEDCRLLQNSICNIGFTTTRQYTDSKTNKISIVYWNDSKEKNLDFVNVDLRKTTLPENAEDGQCQKNWLPFCHNTKSYFVYSISPFIVCDMKSNKILEYKSKHFEFDGLKGSTAPVYFRSENSKEHFIMIVHYCHYGGEGRRYYNRFLTLDKNMYPVRFSRGFKLTETNIEYVSGMCEDIRNKKTYNICYGINDSEAFVTNIDSESIESILWYDIQSGGIDCDKRLKYMTSYTT
jgi:tetratricopeptide (TPR) repeat protein